MLPGAHRQEHQRAQGWAVYWYAWRGGPQIGVFRGATLAEAVAAEIKDFDAVAQAWVDARSTKPAVGLFGRVVTDYMAHHEYQSLATATKATYRVWLDSCREAFGALSERDITPDRVRAWLKGIMDKRGVRARDHAFSMLSRVASFGRSEEGGRQFTDTFKPTAGFKKLYTAPAQDAWTAPEIAKLALLPPRVANILALAYNTGLRRADLCRIAWTNVDWEAGRIRLVTSKGARKGRRVVIRLNPALRATLQRIGVKREGPILTNSHGTAWTRNSIAHAINRALRAVGVEGRLHGLRRSAATQMALQGASSRDIARVLGWSESDAEAMAAIYVSEETA